MTISHDEKGAIKIDRTSSIIALVDSHRSKEVSTRLNLRHQASDNSPLGIVRTRGVTTSSSSIHSNRSVGNKNSVDLNAIEVNESTSTNKDTILKTLTQRLGGDSEGLSEEPDGRGGLKSLTSRVSSPRSIREARTVPVIRNRGHRKKSLEGGLSLISKVHLEGIKLLSVQSESGHTIGTTTTKQIDSEKGGFSPAIHGRSLSSDGVDTLIQTLVELEIVRITVIGGNGLVFIDHHTLSVLDVNVFPAVHTVVSCQSVDIHTDLRSGTIIGGNSNSSGLRSSHRVVSTSDSEDSRSHKGSRNTTDGTSLSIEGETIRKSRSDCEISETVLNRKNTDLFQVSQNIVGGLRVRKIGGFNRLIASNQLKLSKFTIIVGIHSLY